MRHVIRSLRHAPGFSLLAVLAIALGIGASTAVFSVVNGVLLQPLGYTNPQRLVMLYSRHPAQGDFFPPSYLDFVDWRAQAPALAGTAFLRGETILVRGSEGAERSTVALASDGFFRLMGVPPFLGRTFTADDERPGAPRVAVLHYDFWQTRFGGDRGVIGRTLDTPEGSYTIVGVMPATFDFPAWASIYSPLTPVAGSIPALTKRAFRVDQVVIARLAPGVSQAAAAAQLRSVARRLEQAYPAENRGWTTTTTPLRDVVTGDVRAPLVAISWAVALVLLIACANVASLMLARATGRTREMALRMALGAGPWRVARRLVAESLTLAAMGGVAGVSLAWAGIRLLRAAAPRNLPRVDEIALDPPVLGFAVVACALSAVLFGLLPALQAARTDVTTAMREGSAGSGRGARGHRVRAVLVVTELALALVLLVGSTLLIQSVARVRAVNPGFDANQLLVVPLEPPEGRYDTPEKLAAVYERIREAVGALPGVRSAAMINHMPMTGTGVTTRLEIPGRPAPAAGEEPSAVYRLVDSRYFGTIGQPVIRGRGFTAADMTPTSTAIVVGDSLARQLWPGRDPVGQRLTTFRQLSGRPDFGQPVAGEVVGVVADVTFQRLDERQPLATVYLPFTVEPWRRAFVAARTVGDPAALTGAARRVVMAADADLPVASITTVRSLIAGSLTDRELTTTVLSAFAASALTLAVIGVYGIVAYGVTQRTREIGIRTALGARRGAIVGLFVREGVRLGAVGLAFGIALALGGTRLLESMVYGVSVRDVRTFAAVGLVLVVVAAMASLIPARRAARVDPVEALRRE